VIPLCSFVNPKVKELVNFLSQAAEEAANAVISNNKVVTLASYLRLFTVLQGRALSCLSNIICALPVEGLGNTSDLWGLLFTLCAQAFNNNACEEALQATLTTTMYSFLRQTCLQPSNEEVSALFELTRHPAESIRVDAIGMLGCVAKTPLGPQISHDLGIAITKAWEDPSGWVIAEACDVLFSVFDDNFNDVTQQLNLLGRLENLGGHVGSKLSMLDKENLLFSKLDEILDNIHPFLDYKRQQNM